VSVILPVEVKFRNATVIDTMLYDMMDIDGVSYPTPFITLHCY
jgi:hypothetical protein